MSQRRHPPEGQVGRVGARVQSPERLLWTLLEVDHLGQQSGKEGFYCERVAHGRNSDISSFTPRKNVTVDTRVKSSAGMLEMM